MKASKAEAGLWRRCPTPRSPSRASGLILRSQSAGTRQGLELY